MTVIYKDLIASDQRTYQVIAHVAAALGQGRNYLVLTNWSGHLQRMAGALRALGHDPVILKGGMGAKDRAAALARLNPQPAEPPLLAVATGPYAGEGFDCPPLDTLFLAVPVASKGRLLQYVGRIVRPYDGKATAEVHDVRAPRQRQIFIKDDETGTAIVLSRPVKGACKRVRVPAEQVGAKSPPSVFVSFELSYAGWRGGT